MNERGSAPALLSVVAALAAFPVLAQAPVVHGLAPSDWRLTLETAALGPVETVVHFEDAGSMLVASSRSGATELLATLSAGGKIDLVGARAPLVFSLASTGDGEFRGTLSSPYRGAAVTATLRDGRLAGRILDGLLAGPFEGVPFSGTLPLRDYGAVLAALDRVVEARVYNPAELRREGWIAFRRQAAAVASRASDDLDFLLGLRFAWKNDPFSHFQVKRTGVPIEDLVAGLDAMRVGRESARLAFDGPVATLTVETMLGADTIEQIEAAFRRIAEVRPGALVVDLRGNGGGAFAVRPLVQHLLREPLDAGWFTSNTWWRDSKRPAVVGDAMKVDPWQGWSVVAFWRDVQSKGLIRLRFEPQAPVFEGPVFVVISQRSASATEIAADALRASGRARLVGETTLGRVLSGSMFGLVDGFAVMLPVADYTSTASGLLEGSGVAPDIPVPAAEALDRAKAMAFESVAKPIVPR
ncbi:MAG: S41 family peptidase [Thermoanaerobaculaceae bacterium]